MAKTVTLSVSDIRFSQEKMPGAFPAKLNYQNLGSVLDRIYNGDSDYLNDVMLKNMKCGRAPDNQFPDEWFAVSNRRLWVLKELHYQGMLPDVEFDIDPEGIDVKRFTTKSEGNQILVIPPKIDGKHVKPAPFWDYAPASEDE